jgi:hypothetical protein
MKVFIEVYIDNQSVFVIVYDGLVHAISFAVHVYSLSLSLCVKLKKKYIASYPLIFLKYLTKI